MPEQSLRILIRPSHRSKWILELERNFRPRGVSLEAQPRELQTPPGLSATKVHLMKAGHLRHQSKTQEISPHPQEQSTLDVQPNAPVYVAETPTSSAAAASDGPRQPHPARDSSGAAGPALGSSNQPVTGRLASETPVQQDPQLRTGSPSAGWELVEALGEGAQSKTPAIEALENDSRGTSLEGLDSEGKPLKAAAKARVAFPGSSVNPGKSVESGETRTSLADSQMEYVSAPNIEQGKEKPKTDVHRHDKAKEQSHQNTGKASNELANRQPSDGTLGPRSVFDQPMVQASKASGTHQESAETALTNKQSVRGSKFTDEEIKERKRDSLRIATPLELQKSKERIEAEAAASSAKALQNLPESYAKKVSKSISNPQGSAKNEPALSKSASGKHPATQPKELVPQQDHQRLEAAQIHESKGDSGGKAKTSDKSNKARGEDASDNMQGSKTSHIRPKQPSEPSQQPRDDIKPVEA